MGAKGAPKSGGRQRGSRNIRTVELAKAHERMVVGAQESGALAKEVLEELMMFYINAARHYMPPIPIPEDYPHLHAFHSFTERAGHFARMLAPYQSPTYRSITVQAPRESAGHGTPAIDALEAFVLTLAAVRRRPQSEPEIIEAKAAEEPTLVAVRATGR